MLVWRLLLGRRGGLGKTDGAGGERILDKWIGFVVGIGTGISDGWLGGWGYDAG